MISTQPTSFLDNLDHQDETAEPEKDEVDPDMVVEIPLKDTDQVIELNLEEPPPSEEVINILKAEQVTLRLGFLEGLVHTSHRDKIGICANTRENKVSSFSIVFLRHKCKLVNKSILLFLLFTVVN